MIRVGFTTDDWSHGPYLVFVAPLPHHFYEAAAWAANIGPIAAIARQGCCTFFTGTDLPIKQPRFCQNGVTMPHTLQSKLSVFLLLPVAVLLFVMGLLGYTLGKQFLIKQWSDAAVLRLERAAREVDSRLSHPKSLMRLYPALGKSGAPEDAGGVILNALRETKGVVSVDVTWNENESSPLFSSHRGMQGRRFEMGSHWMRMSPQRSTIRDIGTPRYDPMIQNRTVTVISDLLDENGGSLGTLTVVIRFDYLMEGIVGAGWWQSRHAYLVGRSGTILAGAVDTDIKMLGENGNALENAILDEMQRKDSGTVFGERHSILAVAGFVALKEVPWYLVMFAPAREVLDPVFRFEFYYAATGVLCILVILLLIQVNVKRTANAVREVSRAAREVADGKLGDPLPVKTVDEVGEMTRSFNVMVTQLKEREQMKKELELARETQQLLIPHRFPTLPGVDLAGAAQYCDETGGDYYDVFPIGGENGGQWGICVGDVSGHGIPSALLMASMRSALRQRALLGGDPAAIVKDVNRLISKDVEDSGQFITLFFLTLSIQDKRLRWIRAGHDPALHYNAKQDKFNNLSGQGVAIGLDENAIFQTESCREFAKGDVIVAGTDGLWESMNRKGEMFGKKRLRQAIRGCAEKKADQIVLEIMGELENFRQERPADDDVTLIVLKSEN